MSKNCRHWQFLDMFLPLLGAWEALSGKITPYSCRAGPKLRNEWSNIKIRQVLTSEMRKMWGNLKFYMILLNFTTSANYLKSLILVSKDWFSHIQWIYSLNSLNTSTMCPIAHAPHHPCPASRFIHYYGSVPHHPCVPLSMCPIAHVAYCPCAPLPYSHVDLEGSCCITDMPHHSCSPSSMCPITLPLVFMCPIAHVAYCPCTYHPCPLSRSIHYYGSVPHHPCVPLSMCPIAHVPHPPRCPISIFSINQDTHLPTCPIAHMSKKM